MQSNFYQNYLYYLSPNGQSAFAQVPLSPNLSPFSYINFLKTSENQLKRPNPSIISLDQSNITIDKAQGSNGPELNTKSPKQSFSPFEKLSEVTGFGISLGLAGSSVFAEQHIASPAATKTNPIIPTPIRAPSNIQQKQEIPEDISKLKTDDQGQQPPVLAIIESPRVYYSTLTQKIEKEGRYFETTDDLIRKVQIKQQRAKLQKLRENNKLRKIRKRGKANLEVKESSSSQCSSKLKPKTHRIQKDPLPNRTKHRFTKDQDPELNF